MKSIKFVRCIGLLSYISIMLILSGCSSNKYALKEVTDHNDVLSKENTTPNDNIVKKTEASIYENEKTIIHNSEVNPLKENIITINIDRSKTRQTMESFGTSGAWWAQYVGGWERNVDVGTEKDSGDVSFCEEGAVGTERNSSSEVHTYKEGAEGAKKNSETDLVKKPAVEIEPEIETVREAIVRLLFDKETGIGLTCYRYNIGAGSADSGKGVYQDEHRRAQSFEISPGVYDWNKDEKAVWILKKAVETGANEVIFFCNSPLERLTESGMAYLSEKGKVNLLPEHYDEFATYVLDVTEHFVKEGIPVKYVSPINEPQWDWVGGQEGCHYEPKKVVGVYKAFQEELLKRKSLQGIELSGPESGEWKGDAIRYTSAILNNQDLNNVFTTIDCHSYWSDTTNKVSYKNWMNAHYPEVKLRMSEWCEMVNGSDYTMDSAFHLAQTVAEDLTLLDVVSWQNWVAVAPGGYRDGLIYVDEKKQTFTPLKRLWAYGNYSKFIRPGYVRLEIEKDSKAYRELKTVAFTGKNGIMNELIIVCINEKNEETYIDINNMDGLETNLSDVYSNIACYETSDSNDLVCVLDTNYVEKKILKLNPMSITTIVLQGE